LINWHKFICNKFNCLLWNNSSNKWTNWWYYTLSCIY